MPALLVLAALAASCEDDTRPLMAAFDTPTGPRKSLRETFDFIRAANERKAFLSLRPYIEPVQRDDAIDLLLAVDAFTIANAAALQATERACPKLRRAHFDLAPVMTEQLEVFSRHVEIVSEREDQAKGEAAVIILVAGRPPPQEAHFRRLDGHWVYIPGPHIDESTETFRALTKALERVTRSLTYAGQVMPEQVAYQYQLFVAPVAKRMAGAFTDR